MKALAEARKFLVAAAGAIAVIIEAGVLHGNVLHWASVGSAIVAALLVWLVPNATVADLEASAPSFLDAVLEALHHPAAKEAVVAAASINVNATPVTATTPATPIGNFVTGGQPNAVEVGPAPPSI